MRNAKPKEVTKDDVQGSWLNDEPKGIQNRSLLAEFNREANPTASVAAQKYHGVKIQPLPTRIKGGGSN